MENRLAGLATNKVSTQTMQNTDTLAMSTLHRNGQMTSPKSNSTMFLNSRAGRANFDTKFPSPLACVDVMMLALPAMYPHNMIPKHSRRAGNSLLMDIIACAAWGSMYSPPEDELPLISVVSMTIDHLSCLAARGLLLW